MKYSKEEIRYRARKFLELQKEGDPRHILLLTITANKIGLSDTLPAIQRVQSMIEELAR